MSDFLMFVAGMVAGPVALHYGKRVWNEKVVPWWNGLDLPKV